MDKGCANPQKGTVGTQNNVTYCELAVHETYFLAPNRRNVDNKYPWLVIKSIQMAKKYPPGVQENIWT
jgi:hypothetical protein